MARSETIVVGGGIGAIAPFTIGRIPVIVNDDPAALGISKMSQVTVGGNNTDQILIPGMGVGSTVIGGGTTTSVSQFERTVIIGNNILLAVTQPLVPAASWEGVYIGSNISRVVDDLNKQVERTVAIGSNIVLGGGNTDNAIVIGQLAQLGTAGVNSSASVVIGTNALVRGSNSVSLGSSANVLFGETVAIGSNAKGGDRGVSVGFDARSDLSAESVAIGRLSRGQATRSVALGSRAEVLTGSNGSIALGYLSGVNNPNQFVVGSNEALITQVVLGAGAIDRGVPYAQSAVTIRPSSSFEGWAGANNQGGWVLRLASGLGTGSGLGSNIEFQTANIVGVPGNPQTAVTKFEVLQNNVGVGQSPIGIRNVAVFNAASVATLSNSPKAGNPDKWIGINIDGVRHVLPLWQF